jgi:segregation and condensation protein B
MPPLNLRSAVEALLFSSDQPLTLALLAEALDADPARVSEALLALGEEYKARESGVELREMAGGWIVTTTAEQHEWVARMLRGKRRMRLSRAALETLAIIAYKQPVTKSEIESIRGVDSSGTLATLLERSLVTIKGRSTVVGRPLLYGSTPDFLNYFGLKDLAELPRPEELRALVAAREPEQMEMLELDGEGLPRGLPPAAALGDAAETLAAEAAEAGSAAAAPSAVAADLPAASDAEPAADAEADEEYDDDEFEDDDDDEDESDEDEDDVEDGLDEGEGEESPARSGRRPVTLRDPR